MERRTVLIALVCGGSATAASLVGIPTLIYIVSPVASKTRIPRWRDLGPLEDFPVGEMSEAIIQRGSDPGDVTQVVPRGVYVWRQSEREVIIFSRSCTDLGCPVTFDRGSHCFLCPCHGGIFDQRGERMAGPPDRPLYRYEFRILDGVLQVDLSSVPPMV
jgi:menaquinol-cytochrome c reductase iron-sulfur subunit